MTLVIIIDVKYLKILPLILNQAILGDIILNIYVHFKFIKRIDTLVSRISYLKWGESLTKKDENIKGRKKIKACFLNILEKY
jgi:hypothetical protein